MSKTKVPMVKAIYVTPNAARHPLHGSTKALSGRSVDYGYRKNGEVFYVAEADIVARPNSFAAYPCAEPFIIEDGKVIVPCGIEEVSDGFDTLEDIPGVGPTTADKLTDLGFYTPKDVLERADEDTLKSLGTLTAKKIKQWQKDQSG